MLKVIDILKGLKWKLTPYKKKLIKSLDVCYKDKRALWIGKYRLDFANMEIEVGSD